MDGADMAALERTLGELLASSSGRDGAGPAPDGPTPQSDEFMRRLRACEEAVNAGDADEEVGAS